MKTLFIIISTLCNDREKSLSCISYEKKQEKKEREIGSTKRARAREKGGKRNSEVMEEKREFVLDSKANLVKVSIATNTQSRWQEGKKENHVVCPH